MKGDTGVFIHSSMASMRLTKRTELGPARMVWIRDIWQISVPILKGIGNRSRVAILRLAGALLYVGRTLPGCVEVKPVCNVWASHREKSRCAAWQFIWLRKALFTRRSLDPFSHLVRPLCVGPKVSCTDMPMFVSHGGG